MDYNSMLLHDEFESMITEKELRNTSDEKLKEAIEFMLQDKDYIPSAFTSMVKGIINNGIYNKKTRNALIVHLLKYYEDTGREY